MEYQQEGPDKKSVGQGQACTQYIAVCSLATAVISTAVCIACVIFTVNLQIRVSRLETSKEALQHSVRNTLPERVQRDVISDNFDLQGLRDLIRNRPYEDDYSSHFMKGQKGEIGRVGPAGPAGIKGDKGETGAPGTSCLCKPGGTRGPQGARPIAPIGNPTTGTSSEVTYIRWGKTTCPSTDLIYSGFATGRQGGATNEINCFPSSPQLGNSNALAAGSSPSVVLTALTYQTSESGGLLGQGLNGKAVPCALCLAKRSAVIMIPGRSNCMDGWQLEYTGFLMSGKSNASSSSLSSDLCTDINPSPYDGEIPDSRLSPQLTYVYSGACPAGVSCQNFATPFKKVPCVICTKAPQGGSNLM